MDKANQNNQISARQNNDALWAEFVQLQQQVLTTQQPSNPDTVARYNELKKILNVPEADKKHEFGQAMGKMGGKQLTPEQMMMLSARQNG